MYPATSVKEVSMSTSLTVERVRELLDYDLNTGIFTWRISISNRIRVGEIAGVLHHTGYIHIRIAGTPYPAHKLAWFHVHGEWQLVDHKDRNKSNNVYDNLRVANKYQNASNKATYSNNGLGIKGIRQRGSKFEARIQHKGYPLYLGTFDTLEEAIEARQEAAKEYFGEFANG